MRCLTNLSRKKLATVIPPIAFNVDASAYQILADLRRASCEPISMRLIPSNIDQIKDVLFHFDQQFNNINFDLSAFNHATSFQVHGLTCHVLSPYDDYGYLAMIIQVLNIFHYMYRIALPDWHMYVRLDETPRTMPLNIGGLTMFREKQIICTKREEIIKTVFHELIHAVRLNENQVQKQWPWNISDKISLIEAHTELLAVILHSAYVSVLMGFDFDLILTLEYRHTCWLAANILKHYGVDVKTFLMPGNLLSSRVQIWAYVFVRAVGMLDPSFSLDDTFAEHLQIMFTQAPSTPNFSYLMVDLDANKI